MVLQVIACRSAKNLQETWEQNWKCCETYLSLTPCALHDSTGVYGLVVPIEIKKDGTQLGPTFQILCQKKGLTLA